MGRKTYRVSSRQPGRRNIKLDILGPGFIILKDVNKHTIAAFIKMTEQMG